MALRIVPVELREANEFIARHHRHHKPVQGHRFSIGVKMGDQLVGVATVGRPVSASTNPKEVLEVTRLCTDGTKNACSSLYAAAARVGKEMGYHKIQSFILESEYGSSLKASGWFLEGTTNGDSWTRKSRQRADDHPLCPKHRYVKLLNNKEF